MLQIHDDVYYISITSIRAELEQGNGDKDGHAFFFSH